MFTTFIVVCILFLIIKWYWDRYYWTKALPPGPPSIPLLGSLPFMKGGDFGSALTHFASKYGDIYKLDLGLHRCVVLNRYDVLKEALVKHGDLCIDRPNKYIGLNPHGDKGIVPATGQVWNTQRKFAVKYLRDFGFGKHSMQDAILKELDEILTAILSKEGKPFDPYPIFSNASLNVISSFLNGKRYSYTDSDFLYLTYLGHRMTVNLEQSSIHNLFPFLRHVPLISNSIRKLDDVIVKFGEVAQSWVDEEKKLFCPGDAPTNFIEAYLNKMKEEKSQGKFTEEHLKWAVFDIQFGGTDTTATSLVWCMVYMMAFPEVKTKVQEEIESAIGNERQPNVKDRPNLPYCEAVINEILRVSLFAATTLPRVTSADMTISGYHIPCGTSIMLNLRKILRHPLDWKDPETFRPERFLDAGGKFVKHSEMAIFSVGKRNCPGELLGRVEMLLFFVGIMQKFDFRSPDGDTGPCVNDAVYGLLNRPKPFKMVGIPRE